MSFSNNSNDISACLTVEVLGAEVLEFHAVFDRRMFGPGARIFLPIDQIRQLVTGVRQIKHALYTTTDKITNEAFQSLE